MLPTELHLYDEGSHGFGMGNPDHDCSKWPAAAADWLRKLGLIGTVGQV